MPKAPKDTLKEHRPHPWRDFIRNYRNDNAKEIAEKNMTFKDILKECSRLYKSSPTPSETSEEDRNDAPAAPPAHLTT